MHPRAFKLTQLAEMLNLEEGTVLSEAFMAETNAYYAAVRAKQASQNSSAYRLGAVLRSEAAMSHVTKDRAKGVAMRRVNRSIRQCRACPKLNCVGHTEATVALCQAAQLPPVGVCCELMNRDGAMAGFAALERFALEWGLPMIDIAELTEKL